MLNTRRRRINVIEVLGERLRLADGFHPTRLGRRLFYKMFGGTHLVNRAGLARTFQNIRLFREMSVVENLLVAQHMQINRNLLAGILNTPAYRRAESQALDRAFYWLEVVDLVSCANRLAGEMSYGQQRRLAIARALMSRSKLLLLDEPSLGLAPIIVKQIFQILRELAAGGMTLFLVEQNAHHALTLSDRGYVMVNGQIRMSGPGKALLGNEEVRKAYLGGI